MPDPPAIRRGTVVWVDFDPTRGREQAGRRPAVVVSSDGYNDVVPSIVVVLPVTTRDRGLPHHVPLAGGALELPAATYAMTEQPRTIDRERISGTAGRVDAGTLRAVDRWLTDFLGL